MSKSGKKGRATVSESEIRHVIEALVKAVKDEPQVKDGLVLAENKLLDKNGLPLIIQETQNAAQENKMFNESISGGIADYPRDTPGAGQKTLKTTYRCVADKENLRVINFIMCSEVSLTTYRKLKVFYSSMVWRVNEISKFRSDFLERNAKKENGDFIKGADGGFVFDDEAKALSEFNDFLDSYTYVIYEAVDQAELSNVKLKPMDWERVMFLLN